MTAVSLQILFAAVLLLNRFWWAGVLAGLAVIAADQDDDSKWREWLYISAIPAVFPGLAYFTIPYLARPAGIDADPSRVFFSLWIAATVAGILAGFWWLRQGVQSWQKFAHRNTKKTDLERNVRSDIRKMDKHLPDPQPHFGPEKYFDAEKGLFLGLGEDGQALYASKSRFPKPPHMLIAGVSGGGKGVAIGVIAAQWLRAGHAVIFIDPKNDEFAPHVMAESAAKAGTPHFFVNLRDPAQQLNLFEGATAEEIEELLIAGFSLGETGAASDFYAIADRKYAGVMSHVLAEGKTAKECYAEHGEALDEAAPKFAGKLRELGEVAAVNAPTGTGIGLAKLIEDGGSLYIVGSMRHERIIRVQKMLLVRILQIAETRPRLGDTPLRPISVILDELKYHLSKTATEALGAARDKGVNVLMAFQSLNDLRDVRGDLSAEAVLGAVVDNSKIKLVYKAENPETAEWLSKFSGKILVDDESRHVKKTLALAEKIDDERNIRQAETYLMDENTVLSLHPLTRDTAGLGICYGLGIAQFVNISPLRVEKRAENITVTPAALAAPVLAAADATAEDEGADTPGGSWSNDQEHAQADAQSAQGSEEITPSLDDLLTLAEPADETECEPTPARFDDEV